MSGATTTPTVSQQGESSEKPRLSPRELIMLARRDFRCFIELIFPVLHPGGKLDYARYLGVMAQLMMTVSERKRRRAT